MIVGDPSLFAIESDVSEAYSQLSLLASGYFTVVIKGFRYGVQERDATTLACSLVEIQRRIRERGKHVGPYFDSLPAATIVEWFRGLYYTDLPQYHHADTIVPLYNSLFTRHIAWAPNGDSAFDDGSHVLQFDVADTARLIAFKSVCDGLYDPATLNEVFVSSNAFYSVLSEWTTQLLSQWASMPKCD